MDIAISKIHFDEQASRIRAHVFFSERVGDVWHTAEVTIFIDAVDSYAEIKRQSIEKAKAFLLLATSAH